MGRCRLSDVGKGCLAAFYRIQDEMIRGMNAAEPADSISHNLIVETIPHPRGAVQMSKNALAYALSPGPYPVLEAMIASQVWGNLPDGASAAGRSRGAGKRPAETGRRGIRTGSCRRGCRPLPQWDKPFCAPKRIDSAGKMP